MKIFLFCLLCLVTVTASAQFTGPSASSPQTTVAQAAEARVGTYVTVVGNIVAHQKEEYFSFRDATGEMRVEIERSIWQNRKIGPDTRVRLVGEVDTGLAGRYLWVESLQVLD